MACARGGVPESTFQGRRNMTHIIHKSNVVALRKMGETFVFFYDDEDAEATIRTLAQFAADPDLNFSWHDAAVLSRDVALSVGLSVSLESCERREGPPWVCSSIL